MTNTVAHPPMTAASAPSPPWWRPALWIALATALAFIAGTMVQHWRPAPVIRADPGNLHPAFGAKDYAAASATVDRTVEGARRSLAFGPDEWLRMEVLARALISRYRLAGDPADLAEADKLLDKALDAAPFPSGPTLTRAGLSLTLHRLDEAAKSLDRFDRQVVPGPADERADALALRGDIAMQRGDLAGAARAYDGARALADSTGIMMRRATLAARMGQPKEAADLAERALARRGQQPVTLSDLALSRASIAYANGDWITAATWIKAAEKVFPGRWLTRAWAAQHRAVNGDPAIAVRDMTELAADGRHPEITDALAHFLRLAGNGAASKVWADRAAAMWTARIAQFPEAFGPHGAEHELALGDPQRALALAAADAARRPYGQALVPLARAQTLTGNPAAALTTLEKAEKSGWRTELLYLEKATALEALGRGPEATTAREDAKRYNPRATNSAMAYIWFGHD